MILIICDKFMLYDRVKILRNVSTCNNSFKIWSRRTYFIIACVNNGKYVLNDENLYRYYEIRHLNYNVT